MAFIDWNDKLATGIGVIDGQHKKLIGLINDLHSAMRERKGREAYGPILLELADYTRYHFGTEEKAFAKYGYSGAEDHVEKHQDLVRQLGEIEEQFKQGSLMVSVKLLDFLNDWITEHIMRDDMKYVPELRGKEIAE
jgi:hemerythrin-like metal-binding protein